MFLYYTNIDTFGHKKAGSNVTCPALRGSRIANCSRTSNNEATPYIDTAHPRMCVQIYTQTSTVAMP